MKVFLFCVHLDSMSFIPGVHAAAYCVEFELNCLDKCVYICLCGLYAVPGVRVMCAYCLYVEYQFGSTSWFTCREQCRSIWLKSRIVCHVVVVSFAYVTGRE